MKVYVVTDGVYSDYHIEMIVSTREKAEYIKNNFLSDSCEVNIEEWEVDDMNEEDFAKGLSIWRVSMCENGDVSWTERKPLSDRSINPLEILGIHPFQSSSESGRNKSYLMLQMEVKARNEEHAIKIVNEKRTELIALNKFILTKP